MSLSKLAILGLLMEKPMHGYELRRCLKQSAGVFWMINFGSIYPTLRKLSESGYVVGEKKPTRTVDKIVYRITDRGKDEFVSMLKDRLLKEPHVRDEFTLHLFFLDHLLEKDAKELLKDRHRGNRELLDRLLKSKDELEKTLPRYRFSAVERGIMHIETELKWLDRVIKEVED